MDFLGIELSGREFMILGGLSTVVFILVMLGMAYWYGKKKSRKHISKRK